MPHSKNGASTRVVERVAQVPRAATAARRSIRRIVVAHVPVLAEHVGPRVVQVVVGVLPRRGGRDEVPLPGRRVDVGVAHPVPLTVQDVVADLHVLEDLGDGEHRDAGHPRRRQRWRSTRQARPPISRRALRRMTRRMYAASLAPRSARTASRMASSSRPSCGDVLVGEVRGGDRADRRVALLARTDSGAGSSRPSPRCRAPERVGSGWSWAEQSWWCSLRSRGGRGPLQRRYRSG